MAKKALPLKRNPMARELSQELYRRRVVKNKKLYERKTRNAVRNQTDGVSFCFNFRLIVPAVTL